MSNQILVKRQKLDDWSVVAEVFHEPFYSTNPVNPAIVIRQHNETKELRVDIYNCNEGLPVTHANGGTNDSRAKWFRDIRTSIEYSPVRVRFLGSNLELKS